MSRGQCVGDVSGRRWPKRWREARRSEQLASSVMSFCELRSGRNSRLHGYEACLYNLPPLLSASLLSLAFAGRPRLRGGFDLAWECSSLCRPCESLSLSYLLLLFRHPPPPPTLPYLSFIISLPDCLLWFWSPILILFYLLLHLASSPPCFLSSLLSLITALSLSHCPLQSDLLYRECSWPAGPRPGLQPQPTVLPGQLWGRL